MAVEVRPLNARVQIQFDLGVDGNGRPVTRSRTLSNIKSDAQPQDLYDVVEALAGLQLHPVAAIRMISQSELANA